MKVRTKTIKIVFFDKGELTKLIKFMDIEEIAEKTGLTIEFVTGLMDGSQGADSSVIVKLTDALDVTVHQLCGSAFD